MTDPHMTAPFVTPGQPIRQEPFHQRVRNPHGLNFDAPSDLAVSYDRREAELLRLLRSFDGLSDDDLAALSLENPRYGHVLAAREIDRKIQQFGGRL